MALWIWLSLGAAFAQNLRSAVQKRLTATLSTGGATATRFLYGLPFAALWLALLVGASAPDAPSLPSPTPAFALYTLAGALAQIGATALLLRTFATRSFAAGTTFSKTEGLQTVLVGYLVLGDALGAAALAGVATTALGVLLVSVARTGAALPPSPAERWRTVGLGLLSGTLFAVSAVAYRGASLALDAGGDGADVALRAAVTLVAALAVQSLATGVGLALREPGELRRVARAWRAGLVAGAAGAAASAGWFNAFTLVDAALVKAVGSIELAFAMLASRLVFGERPSAREGVGVLVVMAGIVMTVLGA